MAATDGFSESGSDFRTRLQNWLPKIVLAPSFAIMVIFVYGFIAFTIYLSFTEAACCRPTTGSAGRTTTACSASASGTPRVVNLAIFASLYIVISTIIGLMLAIFLDQKIRGEGVLRPIFLYPMALSFIVTGTAWKWMLDPGIGFEATHAGSGGGRASASTGSRTATWRSTRS
jgi:glucose/mannose transport system permease protein